MSIIVISWTAKADDHTLMLCEEHKPGTSSSCYLSCNIWCHFCRNEGSGGMLMSVCAHETIYDSWLFSSCRDRLFGISSEKRSRAAIIAIIMIIIQGVAWKAITSFHFPFFFWLIEESRGKLGEGAGFGGAGDKNLWDGNGVNLLSPWNTSFSRLELWQPGNYIRSSIPHIRLFPHHHVSCIIWKDSHAEAENTEQSN